MNYIRGHISFISKYKYCLVINCLFVIQYFADRDIFCAGRVSEEDLHRVAAATGGTVQTSVNNVIDEVSLLILAHNVIIK